MLCMRFPIFLFIIVLYFECLSQYYYTNSFFRGAGIYGAVTQNSHRYWNKNEKDKDYNIFVPKNYYPSSHISREYFNWGAGIFAEFLPYNRVRWHTELEYCRRGALEKEIINQYIGIRSGSFTRNRYTYFQWNNYLKFYHPIFFDSHWYWMPGIRLEYLFSQRISAFAPYSSSFRKLWFSGNIALGFERPLFKRWSWIFETHYFADIIREKPFDGVYIRKRTIEYRLGLIWRIRQRSIDDCNVPRYKGPTYY